MNTDLEYKGYVDIIISNIKDVIKSEVSSDNDKSEADYLYKCLDLLKRFYKTNKKWSRFHVWSYECTEEVAHIWKTIQPELIAFIHDYLKKRRNQKMTKEIRSASAKAIIDEAMNEADLKYRYIGQTHRAKLCVLMTKDRYFTVHIAYSKLNEQLPNIIQSLKNIRHELNILGGGVTINKIPRTWSW